MYLDSGNQLKLEQFGPYRLIRPASQAVWSPRLPKKEWEKADASFSREENEGWYVKTKLPESWKVEIEGISFLLKPTSFGHLGVFPEQAALWKWIKERIVASQREISVLNLFAYTGGSTLAAALAKAKVTHVDAAKGMLGWAKDNTTLNKLDKAPIRYIVEDARKYLARERKRGSVYDAIILDPPSFGRGHRGEVFKIEDDLSQILDDCHAILSRNPLFLLLTAHTPGYTPLVLKQLLIERFNKSGFFNSGEMMLSSNKSDFVLPSGTFATWVAE